MATSRKTMTDEEWQLLKNIGELYKNMRLASGLTQREAADQLNTSQARVPVLEHGTADVMITTLNRWANLYGFEVQISLVPIEDEFDKSLREAMEEMAKETQDD